MVTVDGIHLRGRARFEMTVAGQALADRLLADGRIDAETHQKAVLHAQRLGDNVEDALIDIGAVQEADLLRTKAAIYQTRFISTAKLAGAVVDRSLLRMVPRRVAEKLQVCPILYDRGKQELSVVAGELENDVSKQLQLVSGVRTVIAYAGRPSAVEAMIKKHYDNDAAAFARFRTTSTQKRDIKFTSTYYDEDKRAEERPTTSGDFGPVEPHAAGSHRHLGDPLIARPKTTPPPRMFGPSSGVASPTRPRPGFTISAPDIPIDYGARPSEQPAPPPEPEPPSTGTMKQVKQVQQVQQAERKLARGTPPPLAVARTVGLREYLELLNVLVALLEQGREELRGHSAQVARLVKKLCERLGLDEEQTHALLFASYLHDIGKSGTYHLTALNVGQYEGHRVQAKKSYLTGARLFEGAKLPDDTVATLEHFYERFDGEGFPDRLTGKEIPLGSRVVALVETYCDLTTHAKNPYRKVLSPNEACEVLVRYKGTFFDPNLVDVFRSVMLGDEFKSRLLADRPKIVICDKDPEENTVLEVRLVEQGFEVVVSRDPGNALERIAQGDVDALITEIDLEPIDGFELVTLARTHREGLPVVFLSSRADADSVNRGFDLGRADYLVKPTSPDVIGAKLRMLLAQNPAPQKKSGVSGSLREMSLPDVLQILANGRKSGRLELESDGQRGELLFSDGAIWDARLGGKRGEEAVYAMLLFEDGSFTLDPDRKPTERVIHGSTEGLLLEGMRRLDEGRR